MKLSIFLLLSIVCSYSSNGQNLLGNPSFDSGSPDPDMYSTGFKNIDVWEGRFECYCGPEPWHSPDWFRAGVLTHHGYQPHSGTGYVGMIDYEIVQQKLANHLIENEEYLFKMWFFLSETFPAGFPSLGWYSIELKIYLATDKIKYEEEENNNIITGNCNCDYNEFCKTKYKTFKDGLTQNIIPHTLINDFTVFSPGDGWHQITLSFIAPPKYSGIYNYEWLGIQMNTKNNSGCQSAYLLIDDVELIKAPCCPDHQIYENTNDLPAITRVSNYIMAGENLGQISPSGPVIVRPDQTVTFKAGNSIILKSGFIAQGNFIATLEDCNIFNNEVYETPMMLEPLADAYLGCLGGPSNYCISTYGANYFECYIYTKLDQFLVFENSGSITTNYTCIWDGMYGGQYPNPWPSLEHVVLKLYLYNDCGDPPREFIQEIAPIIVSCKTSAGFSNSVEDSLTLSRNNEAHNNDLKVIKNGNSNQENYQLKPSPIIIVPNPTHDLITIFVRGITFDSFFSNQITIYNSLGQVIFQSIISNPLSSIDLSSHPPGLYFVKVITGKEVFVQKLVISD